MLVPNRSYIHRKNHVYNKYCGRWRENKV